MMKGFTLVELIVVITIILILAALGVVGMQSANTSAKISSTTGTINNLYMGIELYKSECGKYPDEENDHHLSIALVNGGPEILTILNPIVEYHPVTKKPITWTLRKLFAYDKAFLKNDQLCDPWNNPFIYDLDNIGSAHGDTNKLPENVTPHIVKIFSLGNDKFIYKNAHKL